MLDRRIEPLRSDRWRETKQKLWDKLASICSHLAPPDLDRLTDRMALIEIKYEVRREVF